MEEIWKDIKGFEGKYQVSNLGNVKSLERYVPLRKNEFRKIQERILKNIVRKSDYMVVFLSTPEYGTYQLIHRLVAEAFVPNPENKPFVLRINRTNQDNRAENLMWGTREEYVLHKSGRMPSRENHWASKIKKDDIPAIRKMLSEGVRGKEIAKIYKVAPMQISRIRTGKTWADIPKTA